MSKDKVVRLGKNLVIDPLKGSMGYLYQGRMVAGGGHGRGHLSAGGSG